MNNDVKINALLKKVEEKRTALGEKPKARYNSNAVIEYHGKQYNLNVIDKNTTVELYAFLCMKEYHIDIAKKDLGVDLVPVIGSASIAEWKDDLKLRVNILNWTEEDRKIKVLEQQLKDLRSEDAKTADALTNIEGML